MAKLKVTLVKGKSGVNKRQLATIQALGLTRRTSCVEVEDNEIYNGMISKVKHLIKVEKI